MDVKSVREERGESMRPHRSAHTHTHTHTHTQGTQVLGRQLHCQLGLISFSGFFITTGVWKDRGEMERDDGREKDMKNREGKRWRRGRKERKKSRAE